MPDAPAGSAAWIDALLRERLGAGATSGELGFEGPVLRVAGARLPLGALLVVVERAEIELGAGLPLGELPLSAQLVSLRATIHAGALAVTVELAAGDPAPSWFSGALVARGAAPSTFALTGALDVTPAGFTLVASSGTALSVALASAGALRAEGSRLTGRVVLADVLALGLAAADVAPRPETVVDLDLTARGAFADLALRGRIFSASVVLGRRSRPEAPPLRLDDVHATIDVTRHGLRYEHLCGGAHGARFAGWGRVPFAGPSGGAVPVPLAALAVERAGIALVRALAGVVGAEVRAEVRAPSDVALRGELMIEPSLAASGAFTLETPRTELLFKLALAPTGSLAGSTLRGRLAAADAITLGIFAGPVRPRPPAVLDLDARLTGTVAKPGITGRAACARFALDVFGDASAPSFVVEDASALVDVDVARVAWHRFTGRFYGGTFSSSGAAGRDAGLRAELAWTGVRVELLPTAASGERRLASLLRGAATGELGFERHALDGSSLAARGHVTLAQPRYPLTRALGRRLDRYGLARVRSRGTAPLTARLAFERGVLHVESLTAAVEGVEIAGDAHVRIDGGLTGSGVVHLLEGYLSQGAWLAIPGALVGRVTVPIELGGTVSAPEVRTDARRILEGLLTGGRIGDALKSVVDGLRGVAPKRR